MFENNQVHIESMYKNKNEYYCFAKDMNVLFSINENNGNIKGLCFLPEEGKNKLVGKILFLDNDVILVPLHAEKLYFYNIENEKLDSIDIPDLKDIKYFKFYTGIIHNEYIYLVGCYYPALLKINLKKRELKKIEIYKDIIDNGYDKKIPFTRNSTVIVENILYIATAQRNSIVMVDLKSDTYKIVYVGECDNRYYGIDWDGQAFWLAPFEGTYLVRWIPGECEEKIDFCTHYNFDNNFSKIVCFNDKIFLYSIQSDYSIEYDYKNFSINVFDSGKECYVEKKDEKLYFQDREGIIHIITNESEKLLKPKMEGLYNYISSSKNRWDFYKYENQTFGLEAFLQQIYRD